MPDLVCVQALNLSTIQASWRRRVGQAVRQCLRTGCLDLEVRVATGHELVQPLKPPLLGVGEGGQLCRVNLTPRDEAGGGGVDVDANDMLAIDAA